MKIPSKIKTAILAGAISAAPLANSSAQELPKDNEDKNKIEVVDEKEENIGSKFIQVNNKKDADITIHSEFEPSNKRKGGRIIKDLYQENIEFKNNKEFRQGIKKDKHTLDSIQNDSKNMFIEGSFCDKLTEQINKENEELGYGAHISRIPDDFAAAEAGIDDRSVHLFQPSSHSNTHELFHLSFDKDFSNEDLLMYPMACGPTNEQVNESTANAISAIMISKDYFSPDKENFNGNDLSTTIGKNCALIAYQNDEVCQTYRTRQCRVHGSQNLDEQIIGAKHGVGEITSEEFMYYRLKQVTEKYGGNADIAFIEFKKTEAAFQKHGEKDKLKQYKRFNNRTEEDYFKLIKEYDKDISNDNTVEQRKYYLPEKTENNFKDVIEAANEFRNKKEEFDNIKFTDQELDNAYKTKGNLFTIKFYDNEKNDRYYPKAKKYINDMHKEYERKQLEEAIKQRNEELKASGKPVPNGDKDKSPTSRREKLNYFKQNGTVKDYGKSDKTTQKQPVVQQYNNNSMDGM